MKKHFVQFFSPGTLFAETEDREIDSWDVEQAREMAKDVTARYGAVPYAFQFITRERSPVDLDSHVSERSPTYFIGCKVETLAEIEARNHPDEQTLRRNLRNNGYDRVAVTTEGWKWVQPIKPGDVVL